MTGEDVSRMLLMTSLGDGEVVEQVISQQTAEHEEVTVRRSSLLDEAIRHLQEQQDRQNQPGTEAGPPEQPEAQGPALPPAPSTPRRGTCTPAGISLDCRMLEASCVTDEVFLLFSVCERTSGCTVSS